MRIDGRFRNRLASKEISLAEAHLESARRNLAAHDPSTAANRLYLAVERATVALTIGLDGRRSKDHGYIQMAFDDLCDRGILKPYGLRGWLAHQYSLRLEGDYGTWQGRSARLNERLLATRLKEGETIIHASKQILLQNGIIRR